MVESEEHELIKTQVINSLKEWFDVALQDEYLHTGYRLDVFAILRDSRRFHAEIIWSFSKTNFNEAIKRLLVSDAHVKILIAHPRFLGDKYFTREYTKFAIATRRSNLAVSSSMIDADLLLKNNSYRNVSFRTILENLFGAASGPAGTFPLSTSEKEKIKRVFVPPKEYQAAKETLQKHGIVIITGPPHIGKTALAIFLQTELENEGYKVGQIFSADPRQVASILRRSDKKSAIRIEDAFGSIDFTHTEMADCFAEILREVSSDKKLLMTSRGYIVQKAYKTTRLGELLPELRQFVVDLNLHREKKELLEILTKHLHYYKCVPELYNAVIEKADYIIQRLSFPHNLDIFTRQLCSSGDHGNLEQIINSSEQIEIAVENWFHSMMYKGEIDEAYALLILSVAETYMDSKQMESVYSSLSSAIGDSHQFRGFIDVVADLSRKNLVSISPSLLEVNTVSFSHPAYRQAIRGIILESNSLQRLVFGAFGECEEDYAKLEASKFLLENSDRVVETAGFLVKLSDMESKYCMKRFANLLVSDNGIFLGNEKVDKAIVELIERKDALSNIIVDTIIPAMSHNPRNMSAFLEKSNNLRDMMINYLKKRTSEVQELQDKLDLTQCLELCDIVEDRFLDSIATSEICKNLEPVLSSKNLRLHLARLLINRIDKSTVAGAIARSLKSNLIQLAYDSDPEMRCSIGVTIALSATKIPSEFQELMSSLASESDSRVRDIVINALEARKIAMK